MNFQTWTGFVDHFFQSIARVMPVDGVFSYKVESQTQQKDYYFQNVPKTLVDEYLTSKCCYDPLFVQNHYNDPQAQVLALHQQPIQEEYQGFLQRIQMTDNVELLFRVNNVPVRGISLIRSHQYSAFSDLEMQMIQSCYMLGNYYLSQMLIQNHTVVKDYTRFGLTKKEQQVIELICAGKSNQIIAEQMFISVPTVKTHIQHIFQKMQVNNKQQLMSHFIE